MKNTSDIWLLQNLTAQNKNNVNSTDWLDLDWERLKELIICMAEGLEDISKETFKWATDSHQKLKRTCKSQPKFLMSRK